MSEIQDCLSLSPLFSDLEPGLLADLSAGASRIELGGGSILFNYGDAGDAMYLVTTGRLRASIKDEDEEVIVGDIGRGDVVGEFALITGEPRSATVRALRDSVLVRIGKQDVENLLDRHPRAMLQLVRLIVMRASHHGHARHRDALRSTRTLALVPAHDNPPDLQELARSLSISLASSGKVRILNSETVESELGKGYSTTLFEESERNSRLLGWLNDLEAENRYLIYQSDAQMSPWTRRCIRQADCLLMVADSTHESVVSECAEYIKSNTIRAPVELLLLHRSDKVGPCTIEAWHESSSASSHHHLTQPLDKDVARVARQVTGCATGVVFGGGGARGFAHLGLIRALESHDIPIDLTGGTSIGALVSALVAQARPLDEIRDVMVEMFIANNYLNDYSLSRVSLIKGKKFRGRLNELFGDQRIEDLPIPFFCVSTNLTRGAPIIHESGFVKDWVASSMTIPGIGPPVVWNGDLLVDGALLNNVPTDVMQWKGRGSVIASDVSNAVELRVEGVDSSEPRDLLNFLSEIKASAFNLTKILFRSATLVDQDQVQARRASADLYLRMPVEGIGTFDWEEAQVLEQRAYDYASKELERFIR